MMLCNIASFVYFLLLMEVMQQELHSGLLLKMCPWKHPKDDLGDDLNTIFEMISEIISNAIFGNIEIISQIICIYDLRDHPLDASMDTSIRHFQFRNANIHKTTNAKKNETSHIR